MERVLEDALRVLAEIGVECRQPVMVERLAARFGSYADHRVRFDPKRVRAHLEATRGRALQDAAGANDEEFSLGGCWAGINYCDPETGAIRPARSDECAQMCRLWDARDIAGVVPVVPGDVPPEIQALAAERIALKNSRHLGGCLPTLDAEEVRYLMEMNRVAGRRYVLAEQVCISPLRFNDQGIELALAFVNNPDVQVSLAGFIPMAGASCPLDPRSAIVQIVAEELAHSMASDALGVPHHGFGLRLDPFDFQYALIVFGSPEWCLYRTLVIQMAAFLNGGQPVRGGSFRSMAKQPDEQAACERTASVLWQAMLGARHFGAVGQLSVDEVFSPQQAVIDREILAYVARLVRGMEVRRDVDSVALIREGVAQGSFSGVPDTVERFRDFCSFPDLFRHWNVERWRANKEPSILGEAWVRAKEEIARSTHRLQPDQEAKIDAIYSKAVEHVRAR
jgi:trimethylamine:corrinoid methyltransferase-like protein